MKKWLALLLVAVMVLSLTACGNKEEEEKGTKQNNGKNDPSVVADALYDEAMAKINSGNYEEAYLLLKDVKNTKENKSLIALKNNLVWMPVEILHSDETKLLCAYDKNGNPLSQFVNWDGEYRAEYAYDANGHLLTRNEYEDGELRLTTTYTYDQNGNCLTEKRTYHDGGDDWSLYTYTYTADGHPATQEWTNSDGDWSTYRYTYDADGNCIRRTSIDENDEITTTYTYDADGNCLTEENSHRKYVYTYDKYGNCLTEKVTRSNGSWDEYIYTYDANGNLLTEAYSDSYGDWDKTKYTYDANGNLLSEEFTDADGTETTTYNRTYDQYGNVTAYEEYTASWKLCYFPNGTTEPAWDCLDAACEILDLYY